MADSTVPITVLFFAKAKELVGKSSFEVSLPKSGSLFEIVAALEEIFPDLVALSGRFVLALNEEYLDSNSGTTLTLNIGNYFRNV